MDGRLMNWLLKRGRGDRWFVGTGGGGIKPAIEITGGGVGWGSAKVLCWKASDVIQ